MSEEMSLKEKRIRSATNLYYSRQDVQEAIYKFCKNRETVPSFMMQAFGKRPDTLQYKSDIFELVKKGATSFHCSQEIWKNPLDISTDLSEKQLDDLRDGWDLLIDIDSKYIDYSKIFAELVIELFHYHNLKSFSIKFSGSKGFHIIVPWKAFPKEMNSEPTKDKFPELPRIITKYIAEITKEKLVQRISELSRPNKYIKDYTASKEVIPDLVLVSSRHLFRAPYSLHEKTSLASVVIDPDQVSEFELKDADPMKVKVENFYPDAKEGEASELLREALDWYKENNREEEPKKEFDFKPIKIEGADLAEKNFPPCIQNILKGVEDGRKRAVFVLLNFFRSLGLEKDELEKKIYEWNSKNPIPLKQGYIKAQLSWSLKHKIVLPPNCKEFYQGIGVCVPSEFCSRVKNPTNYVVRKSFIGKKKTKKKTVKKNK